MNTFDARKLPPMKTLRGFEAVARRLSFRKAAEELHLSHQAVSQQIAQLEASLGQTLFIRQNRQVTLTPEGTQFYEYISKMLNELADQCESLRQQNRKPSLKLHTYVTVALRWLVPILPQFRKQHPDIDIHLLSTIYEQPFDEQEADIGLIFQPQVLAPQLHWQPLLTPRLYPVCHPELLDGKRITSQELIQYPLINITSERHQWSDWFSHLDIPEQSPDYILVDSTAVALEMARDKEGILLIYDPIVSKDLSAGRLIRPVPDAIEEIEPWGLVYRQDQADLHTIQCFVSWLTKQMGEVQIS